MNYQESPFIERELGRVSESLRRRIAHRRTDTQRRMEEIISHDLPPLVRALRQIEKSGNIPRSLSSSDMLDNPVVEHILREERYWEGMKPSQVRAGESEVSFWKQYIRHSSEQE